MYTFEWLVQREKQVLLLGPRVYRNILVNDHRPMYGMIILYTVAHIDSERASNRPLKAQYTCRTHTDTNTHTYTHTYTHTHTYTYTHAHILTRRHTPQHVSPTHSPSTKYPFWFVSRSMGLSCLNPELALTQPTHTIVAYIETRNTHKPPTHSLRHSRPLPKQQSCSHNTTLRVI